MRLPIQIPRLFQRQEIVKVILCHQRGNNSIELIVRYCNYNEPLFQNRGEYKFDQFHNEPTWPTDRNPVVQ